MGSGTCFKSCITILKIGFEGKEHKAKRSLLIDFYFFFLNMSVSIEHVVIKWSLLGVKNLCEPNLDEIKR